MNDKLLIKTLKAVEPATVAALSKALKADPVGVRQRLQRLKRDGVIEVAMRARHASVTECTYNLAAEPERAVPFEGYMSAVEAASFRAAIANTPWAQMGSLI